MRTIVWDVDDVLNDLMHAWFTSVWKPAHPDSQLSYRDIAENPPYQSLGISRSEYLVSLDEFRLSEQARRMEPNAAVLGWLRSYGDSYRHVALTARPLDSAPAAAEWVFRHFGEYFRCFGLVPSRPGTQVPLYDRDKGDFLEWLGRADFFVDDSTDNIALAQRAGIKAILYPQPWNGATYSPGDVLRTLTESVVVN
jgi:phosphoglycolate phosphatase-like HAD superfamily hydrolase